MGVAVLIFFINHVAKSIQASQVLAAIASELHEAIERLMPAQQADEQDNPHADSEFEKLDSAPVVSPASGYLQAVDTARLLAVAVRHNLVLRLRVRPGDFVATASLLLHAAGPACSDKVNAEMQGAFIFGPERTMTQDLEFGLYQLTEVAIRALSPGNNAPHTAHTAVDLLGEVLAAVAARPFPRSTFRDEQGATRLIERPFTFEGMVDAAFNEIRQYGATSAAVTIRMLEALTLIAERASHPSLHAPLLAQAEMIARSSREKLSEQNDMEDVEKRRTKLLGVLHAR
jgi:uncharacterized membrane protein